MLYFRSKNIFKTDSNVSVERQNDVRIIEHTHDFIEVIYIESGCAYHKINNIEYEVKKGDILFIDYGETHSFRSEEGFTFYNILFTPGFFSKELVGSKKIIDLLSLSCFESFSSLQPEPKVTFDASEIVFIERIIHEMDREYKNKKNGYEQVLKSYITALLINMFRKTHNSDILSLHAKIPTEILDYLDNNYDKKIEIKDLAQRSCYTPSYFSRVFKKSYGITVTDYILQKRFKRACELLETSEMSIEEIALKAGYKDASTIFSQFKKKLGLTPREYRIKVRKSNK